MTPKEVCECESSQDLPCDIAVVLNHHCMHVLPAHAKLMPV